MLYIYYYVFLVIMGDYYLKVIGMLGLILVFVVIVIVLKWRREIEFIMNIIYIFL